METVRGPIIQPHYRTFWQPLIFHSKRDFGGRCFATDNDANKCSALAVFTADLFLSRGHKGDFPLRQMSEKWWQLCRKIASRNALSCESAEYTSQNKLTYLKKVWCSTQTFHNFFAALWFANLNPIVDSNCSNSPGRIFT